MVTLYDTETNARLCTITDEQFDFISAQLEEEFLGDTDYYINLDTIDNFKEAGADEGLITALTTALRGKEEMEFRWEKS